MRGVTGRGLKESRVLSLPQTDPKSSADTLKGHHTAFYSVSVTVHESWVCMYVRTGTHETVQLYVSLYTVVPIH